MSNEAISNETSSVLVVEDDPEQRRLVSDMLQASGYQVLAAESVEEAILTLKAHAVDVVFSDWKLGNLSGIELLHYVRRNQAELGFVIATAYGTISHAVEALQQGADDYLPKPFQRQELLLTVQKALKAKQLRSHNQQLSEQLSQQQKLVGLVGNAPCMQKVYQRIDKVSATNATVLILGESGTGKELAARALHQQSPRANEKFIAINCGAIAESLAEAELFGAEKGAFTGAEKLKIGKFEAANNGTIFLDEIGELPLSLQAHLLRFLQEGTITRLGSHQDIQLNVRVIAATHRDLQQQASNGDFREDLYYRLNVVPIHMPPLRERQQDIPLLIEHFLATHAKRHQCDPVSLSETAYRNLLEYHWPGNVRELANRIERFVLLNDEEEFHYLSNEQNGQATDSLLPDVTFPETGYHWDNFERFCLEQALARHQGNKTKAAKYLTMSYKAFLYRLEKYQIN